MGKRGLGQVCRTPFFMSGCSEKRSYALDARIMTSCRKPRGEGIDAAVGYSWHFGRAVTLKTAWFVAEHDDPVVKKVILVAPQTWDLEYEAQGYEDNYGKP